MDREWAARLRLVTLEDGTVESIQTVGTSQPKVPVRGLCQRCNRTRRAFFRPPRCMRELRNGPIAVKRGRTRSCKRQEKADLQRPNNVSRAADRNPASSRATEIRPSSAQERHSLGTVPSGPVRVHERAHRTIDLFGMQATKIHPYEQCRSNFDAVEDGFHLPPGIPHARIALLNCSRRKTASHARVSGLLKK